MLIVHGYTGAFDKVSRRVATFLRAKEDRRAPRPLYGDWTPSPVPDSATDLPERYQQVLLQRGYLTYLSREAELKRFRMLADAIHAQAQWPSFVLMPTYDCNLRCFYCFQDHMRSNPEFSYLLKRMTHPMVDRIFDAMPNIEAIHGISQEDGYLRPITLFGGEPLLRENRDLIEHILQRARQGGTQSCSVVTNGTDLDACADLLGPGRAGRAADNSRRSTRRARPAAGLPGRSGIVRTTAGMSVLVSVPTPPWSSRILQQLSRQRLIAGR